MSEFYTFLNDLVVDNVDLQAAISNTAGWYEIAPAHEQRGYVQSYKKYEPTWLTEKLLPIWSYMGLLSACGPGEYLPPHVDNGRTCAILIPCTDSYKDNTLDFWDMPDWSGVEGEWNDWRGEHSGKIKESIIYTDPILFKNVPHGVDNTHSNHYRINFSVCFLPPYTYETVKDLYNKGLLLK